jgi:hypothetical protein
MKTKSAVRGFALIFALLGTAGRADALPTLDPEISPGRELPLGADDSRQQVASTQSVLRHILLTEKQQF